MIETLDPRSLKRLTSVFSNNKIAECQIIQKTTPRTHRHTVITLFTRDVGHGGVKNIVKLYYYYCFHDEIMYSMIVRPREKAALEFFNG